MGHKDDSWPVYLVKSVLALAGGVALTVVGFFVYNYAKHYIF
ncbi:MAG TPA: hypothetical protein PKZ27_02820 [Rhodocyclaceae bacterium]|mgnify:FL=1|nr:hypothetical protein [Rhodocyclaceae bacterium]